MGVFDDLKAEATKRAKSLFHDAGTSVTNAVKPKSPFPLSTSTLTDAVAKKARAGADVVDAKVRSKAGTLQDNTIGKVTRAVNARVDGEVARVEKKVDDKVAAVEKDVDGTLTRVGATVDDGIAGTNKSLDKALGREEAKTDDTAGEAAVDAAPELETVAAAEAKDGADTAAVPLAAGFTEVGPATRKRSNAVVIGAGRSRAGATAEPVTAEPVTAEPVTAAGETTAEPVEAAEVEEAKAGEPAAEIAAEAAAETNAETNAESETGPGTEAVAEAVTEQKDDGNSEEAVKADAEHDHEGLANSEAAERLAEEQKAAAELAAEEAAQAAGEQADDDVPEQKDDPKVAAEPELSADELAGLGEERKDDTDEQARARAEFRKKIRGLANELRHLLGGGLAATSSASDTGDPWIAFFIASNAFKKKLLVRDLKDELAGRKKANGKAKDEVAPQDEGKTDDDGTPVVEEATGPENRDETEVDVAGGVLRRGTASTTAGEPVDTTGPEVGSAAGRQIFVADKSHKLFVGYRPVKDNDHNQLLGPDDAAVGGEIRVEAGKIDFMSNDRSGDQESAEPFVSLLRSLRDAGGIPMNFDVFEASKKDETTAEKLLEAADKAAPEAEQVDLLVAMKKIDAWKDVLAGFSEALIAEVGEKQGWKASGEQIVDAAGPLDPADAKVTLDKARSKSLANEAAALLATRRAKRGHRWCLTS